MVQLRAKMRGKRCGDDLFSVVCKVYDECKSKHMTAKVLHLSRSTVRKLLRRRKKGTYEQIKVPLGRPEQGLEKSFSTRVQLNRHDTCNELGGRLGLSIGQIRRRLHKLELKRLVACRNILSERARKARLDWCKRHQNTNFSVWIFSDECAFEVGDCSAPKRARVTREKGTKYAPYCVVQGGVKSRQKVMIWGCITANGESRFEFVDGTMNEEEYIRVLQEYLVDLLDSMPLAARMKVVFQQDNARVHTTARLANFFMTENIELAEWAAYSADLSVIENIWKLLKDAVRKLHPQNVKQLKGAIAKCWPKVVTKTRCSGLFATMRRKIAAVQKKRGML